MMITFSLMYLLFYCLIFLSLLLLSFLAIPSTFLTQFSLSVYFTIMQKYTNYKFIVNYNFLVLTGLPPFSLFLIKFNILTYIMYSNHVTVTILMFITLLLNMFYYAQIFNNKNYKTAVYPLLTRTIFKGYSYTHKNFQKATYSYYFVNLFLVNSFICTFLSIFLYTEFFLIIGL